MPSQIDSNATRLGSHDPARSPLGGPDASPKENLHPFDEKAYANIYKENASLLFSYGLKLIDDRSVVKDCIQDLFVDLWERRDKLGEIKTIKPYLFKCLRSKVFQLKTREKAIARSMTEIEASIEEDPSIEKKLIEKQRFDEERKKLQKVLSMLGDKQREILHLKFYAKLSYDEIGQVMGLDRKAAYNLMAYSVKLLRKHAKEFFVLGLQWLQLH